MELRHEAALKHAYVCSAAPCSAVTVLSDTVRFVRVRHMSMLWMLVSKSQSSLMLSRFWPKLISLPILTTVFRSDVNVVMDDWCPWLLCELNRIAFVDGWLCRLKWLMRIHRHGSLMWLIICHTHRWTSLFHSPLCSVDPSADETSGNYRFGIQLRTHCHGWGISNVFWCNRWWTYLLHLPLWPAERNTEKTLDHHCSEPRGGGDTGVHGILITWLR